MGEYWLGSHITGKDQRGLVDHRLIKSQHSLPSPCNSASFICEGVGLRPQRDILLEALQVPPKCYKQIFTPMKHLKNGWTSSKWPLKTEEQLWSASWNAYILQQSMPLGTSGGCNAYKDSCWEDKKQLPVLVGILKLSTGAGGGYPSAQSWSAPNLNWSRIWSTSDECLWYLRSAVLNLCRLKTPLGKY